jgi:asparagine synthase (glutamine-hydrolysing)
MALGCEFRSGSDTEVLLAAYATWGSRCLDRLNGMWAFAIYDKRRKLIFAARDRFGIKPFYYVLTERYFAFGSEICQLLPLLPAVSANSSVVRDYLLTGVRTQTYETFFERVSALLPGYWLEYDINTDHCSTSRYYNLLHRVATGPASGSEGDAISKVRMLIEDSVRIRLRSDVRVGTCLSGGVDSSTIALIAAKMHRNCSANAFTAITAVSEDEGNDESKYAARVVEAGDLAWIRVRPDYDAFRRLLPQVIRHQEEPFSTPSICMQAFVMKAARENGVAVLLDGQGADEAFLGYDKYYATYASTLLQHGGPLGAAAGMKAILRNNDNMSTRRLAAYLVFALLPGLRRQHYRSRSSYVTQRRMPDWIGQLAASCHDSQKLQALEIESTTLPSLLRFEDKNSMAFSIEARLPFLDYRLVEHALSISPELKIYDGWTKWPLRQAMKDILPADIAWRRRKIGFEAPTELWLSRYQESMIEAVRGSKLIARFCDTEKLARKFVDLDRNHQWRLYGIAEWESTFNIGI